MDIKEKFAILIPPWDEYSDLWEPFFNLFFRFWPDCPFKVYLPTYKPDISILRVKIILLKDNYISWSDLLIKTLSYINEPYVFLFFQDLFLCVVELSCFLQFNLLNSK